MFNKRITTQGLFSLCLASSLIPFGCVESSDADVDVRSAEIIENLLAAGFSADEIEVRDAEHLSEDLTLGEFEPQVFIDGDTHVTLAASRELAGKVDDEDTFRMWRTPNLVNNNTTICLAKTTTAAAGYTPYVLTASMQSGVDLARDNFNLLASFNLTMVSGNAAISSTGALSHSIPGCTYSIYIYQVTGGAGGSAGFPSGGAPYNQVQLNSGLTGYSLDVHEHVATHEVSHAIGMRHADWKTRASCGQNSNEGQSGAVLIPGTVDQTTDSIMASCFTANTNGELRGQDSLAYDTLY